MSIVNQLGLRRDVQLGALGANPRKLLGLETAFANGAEVVVFDTRGNDPTGRQAIFQAVAERVKQGMAAVYLSYPTVNGAGVPYPRACPPSARCFEVDYARPTATVSR